MKMVSSMEREVNAGPGSPPAVDSSKQPRGLSASLRKFTALGLALLAVFLVGGTTLVLFPGMVGYGSGSDASDATSQRVSRGRVLITVTEDGNLESASNVEVRCQVAGGGTIIWIIPDGSM